MNKVPFIYSGFVTREQAEAFIATRPGAEILTREEVVDGEKTTKIIVRTYENPDYYA